MGRLRASDKLQNYDFDLPKERIAKHPIAPRDKARLLVVGNPLLDRTMRDLPELLQSGDLLVFNDTRVLPTRLFGHRDKIKIEVTLHKALSSDRWLAFAKPVRKLKTGSILHFQGGLKAEVLEKRQRGEVFLRLNECGEALITILERIGRMPLPPYIRHAQEFDAKDREDYQTIFATKPGAVAAPTAGLHYTKRLLNELEAHGIGRTMLTLHVGAGTFRPITSENLSEHHLHSEWGSLSKAAAKVINETRAKGGRIVPVGTTALRLLETAADADGQVHAFEGETSLFITPGHIFRVADLLLTNFHLQRSTLFVLVCAFAGRKRMLEAYAHAIDKEYRFFSYGDCCLLTPQAKQ